MAPIESVDDRRAVHAYVHVPFCARRCSYCDFAIAVRPVTPWRDYVDAVGRECQVRDMGRRVEPLRTLYLGGGTPSRLGGEGVPALLSTLSAFMPWRGEAEVTLEANPEDIAPAAVAAWRSAGINRLSIGVQSLDDSVLRWMHRVHDADAARRAVSIARDGGISDLSLDLIFAAPARLARSWERDLDAVLALAPPHISLYGLTVEPHTPLGKWTARGEVVEADEQQYADEFLLAHDRLTAAGYEHYEVSNYARPGHRAVHNSAYWTGAPYVAVGPSAHGFDGAVRRANVSAYAAWRATVRRGDDPCAVHERLTEAQRDAEAVYLGLRTMEGLALRDGESARVARWIDAGWVWVDETCVTPRLRCTAEGWMRLDALAADLTALRSHS